MKEGIIKQRRIQKNKWEELHERGI
jgi:hypothetical protein